MEMFELFYWIFRIEFYLLKIAFKIIKFTGAYMVLLGYWIAKTAYITILTSSSKKINISAINSLNYYDKVGIIIGSIFCLYIFVRNIVRKTTGDRKAGILKAISDARINRFVKKEFEKEHQQDAAAFNAQNTANIQ